LDPQAHTAPSARRPRTCPSPEAIAEKPLAASTEIGDADDCTLPRPSCPCSLPPQRCIEPSAWRAALKSPPAAIGDAAATVLLGPPMNAPNACGPAPTGTVATMTLVVASMTASVLLERLATKTPFPPGLTATPN